MLCPLTYFVLGLVDGEVGDFGDFFLVVGGLDSWVAGVDFCSTIGGKEGGEGGRGGGVRNLSIQTLSDRPTSIIL